jgi:hypothetical protein
MPQRTTITFQQPGPVRRTIGFLMALAMTIGGPSLLIFEFLGSDRVFSILIVGACVMSAVGAYWLWIDYISPTPSPEQ